jgi:hypothetical protein
VISTRKPVEYYTENPCGCGECNLCAVAEALLRPNAYVRVNVDDDLPDDEWDETPHWWAGVGFAEEIYATDLPHPDEMCDNDT